MIDETLLQDKAEQLAELEMCANGSPYFLIVQNGDNIVMRTIPNFDISLIFQAIERLIKRYPEYKSEFAEHIIELSKTI